MLKKIATFILTITLSSVSYSQDLSKDTYSIFKNDASEKFIEQPEYKELTTCFTVGKSSYTLLAMSIKMNAEACFSQLISEKEIDLNLDCTGKTPLHYAAKYGRLDMLKKLITAGADPSKTYKDRSVLDYAKKYEQQEIVSYLEKM